MNLFVLHLTVNNLSHVFKQDVTGSEVEKRIPIGLKQVHSFTLRYLLCNPLGCHGDCMLWQVNMAQSQRAGPHQEMVKHRAITHMAEILSFFIARENKVCLCVCTHYNKTLFIPTFKYLPLLFKFSLRIISYRGQMVRYKVISLASLIKPN